MDYSFTESYLQCGNAVELAVLTGLAITGTGGELTSMQTGASLLLPGKLVDMSLKT